MGNGQHIGAIDVDRQDRDRKVRVDRLRESQRGVVGWRRGNAERGDFVIESGSALDGDHVAGEGFHPRKGNPRLDQRCGGSGAGIGWNDQWRRGCHHIRAIDVDGGDDARQVGGGGRRDGAGVVVGVGGQCADHGSAGASSAEDVHRADSRHIGGGGETETDIRGDGSGDLRLRQSRREIQGGNSQHIGAVDSDGLDDQRRGAGTASGGGERGVVNKGDDRSDISDRKIVGAGGAVDGDRGAADGGDIAVGGDGGLDQGGGCGGAGVGRNHHRTGQGRASTGAGGGDVDGGDGGRVVGGSRHGQRADIGWC